MRFFSTERGGLLMAAVAAVLFSAKAILAKLMYQLGTDATTVIGLRLAMAGPVFVFIALTQMRLVHRAPDKRLSVRERWLVLLLGFVGYYLSSLLDFAGLQYIPAALERLILFLTPTLVALLSWLSLRKRMSLRQMQALGFSYLGLVLVLWDQLRGADGRSAHALMIGGALCFAAACSYAVYLVLSGELVKKIGSLRLVAYAMSVSTALTLLHCALFAKQTLAGWPQQVYFYSALNALLCTIVPVYLTMFSVGNIGAARTSQLSMLGPISLIFLGAWILHEPIGALQLAGTVIVLSGIWVLTGPTLNKANANANVDA
jgi:drug/metabolite transporter (DMT)-like permease